VSSAIFQVAILRWTFLLLSTGVQSIIVDDPNPCTDLHGQGTEMTRSKLAPPMEPLARPQQLLYAPCRSYVVGNWLLSVAMKDMRHSSIVVRGTSHQETWFREGF
jgi:hypothetical protein